jgi:hypothetical protein
MNLSQIRDYYSNKPIEFLIKPKTIKLDESTEYIPRFSLKDLSFIENIPINEPIKYSKETIIKAIKYGMIFLINYKGAEDSHFAGHERVVYFMVIGRSSKGKTLIRAWHLNGWSVSNKRHINKIWRLFRADRILSMTFTGSFFRLPPSGYKANDRGMKGGIIAKADFNEIRRNQQKLINQNKIQNREEVEISKEGSKFSTILVKDTETKLDLKKPMDNPYIERTKNDAGTRITFCKSIYGNKYISVLGAMGQPGNTVKIKVDGGDVLGVYKVLDSTTGQVLKNIKNVKGNSIYDLYIFDKKL